MDVSTAVCTAQSVGARELPGQVSCLGWPTKLLCLPPDRQERVDGMRAPDTADRSCFSIINVPGHNGTWQ